MPRDNTLAVPKSVLVVDDEDSIRALLTRVLSQAGVAEVVAVGDGKAALAALGARPYETMFDVLVTDKSLPGGIDGHAIIDEARKLAPHIGVIMVSGVGTLESTTRGFRQRIDYYLLKPFDDIDDFVDVVFSAHRTHAHIKALEASREALNKLLKQKDKRP